ncbi:hypothetical protein BI330_12715 [Mycobacterium sp. CBMA 623]|nr:hypothetical protein [Mycobacteroides sp. CBMA 326]
MHEIIRGLAPLRRDEIATTDRIIDDLGYDSVRAVELCVVLEMEFELRPITETEAIGMRTVGDVVGLVLERIASSSNDECLS